MISGSNMASERVRLGLNQEQLGERLGYGTKTICKWEQDMSTMPGAALKQTAEIFGCSIDYLVGNTNERLPKTAAL